MKIYLTLLCVPLLLASCTSKPEAPKEEIKEAFSFVFMTDIHLKPELRAPEGFQMAIDTVNEMNPDFVITGGDLVDDVLKSTYGRADTLYKLYLEMVKGFKMPVYNTMGNHENYGFSSNPAVTRNTQNSDRRCSKTGLENVTIPLITRAGIL